MGKGESQHEEWKESWSDDCLRALCAFANTDGGRLTVPGVTVGSLDQGAIAAFRREAAYRKHLTEGELGVPDGELLSRLHLTAGDGVKRAGVLLFHKDPMKYISGCRLAVGRFNADLMLEYDDDLTGPLFSIADRAIDLIYTKYLRAVVGYEVDRRTETFPYPREAVREAIFNALIHSNYSEGNRIQVRVSDASLRINNPCLLPPGWTPEAAIQAQRSTPGNPNVAEAFHIAGYVETWGQGIQRIYKACDEAGVPRPRYEVTGNGLLSDSITVVFTPAAPGTNAPKAKGQPIEERVLGLISANSRITLKELAAELGVSRNTAQRLLSKMAQEGVIERKNGKKLGYWRIASGKWQ